MRFDFPRAGWRWSLAISSGVLLVMLAMRFNSDPAQASIRSPDQPRASRSQARAVGGESAFWKLARVPLADHGQAAILIDPASLGVPTKPPAIDHRARLDGLAASGSATDCQVALLDWFSADPTEARNWLAGRESLTPFQPALKMISESVASQGDCPLALEWAALLEPGDERDGTVARIYSAGYRQGSFSMDDLAGAPLTDQDRRNILNGSASD